MDAASTPSHRAAVVGGGPAGLMTAEVLGRAGAQVTVYEQMPTVGRKLQVAGRGGLNLTHSEPTARFLDRYGAARDRLASAVTGFDASALRAWSLDLGQPTFVGTSGRVFPDGFRATTLLRAWLQRLGVIGVEVKVRHRWEGWSDDGHLLMRDGDGEQVTVRSDVVVLALGGASWPRTGSDGRWVEAVTAAGVEVEPLRPSNCGFEVAWTEVFRERFAGTPLKDVILHHQGARARGDAMVTEHGIEGGPVYALSADMRRTIDRDDHALMRIDFFPDRSPVEVSQQLQRRARDSAATRLARAGVAPVAAGLVREVTGNAVPTEADELAGLLKDLPLRLERTRPISRAISSAGGVTFDEVDDHYMLKARPGTFVAGEMLDWEAPTGGYLLQGAFSTGVAAARGALAWLERADRP